METYLITSSIFTFIIMLCKELRLGLLIRLWLHKKLHPQATLKDIENFEKNTKPKYFLSLKKDIEPNQ